MLSTGDHASVPDLTGPRTGAVTGTVAAMRDGRVLLELHGSGRRRWFDADRVHRTATPEEVLHAWFAATPPLVVIPCGKRKTDGPAPAGLLYTGAQHRLARQAADALAGRLGAAVMILSAKHGLVRPDTVLEPYDLTVGDPGAVTGAAVARQLRDLDARTVYALTPRPYSGLLAASRRIQLHDLLAGTRGLLEQRSVLAGIRDNRSGPLPRGVPAPAAP